MKRGLGLRGWDSFEPLLASSPNTFCSGSGPAGIMQHSQVVTNKYNISINDINILKKSNKTTSGSTSSADGAEEFCKAYMF